MDHRRLGRSGLKVSAVALGTMNLGTVVRGVEATNILDLAVDHGITFFDTADVYGAPPLGQQAGATENLLGQWMESRRTRDRIVLATKTYGEMGPGPNDRGLSALHVRTSVDASLRRLRTDRIDLLQMHHVDREVPTDEVLGALDHLRQQGKVLYVGSSNFAGWNIAQYVEEAQRLRAPRLVSEQTHYNLAERTAELEVLPAALHYGVGVLPWSPLGGGLLGGILSKTDTSRSRNHPRLAEKRRAVEAYESLARDLRVGPAELALAWLMHQPAITAPIIGPRTPEHVKTAVTATAVQLSAETLARLDEIWPGPGTAPEAYAW